MKLLVVAGDAGGARAVKAVLERCEKVGKDFTIIDYRFLSQESPQGWKRRALQGNWQESLTVDFRRGVFNIVLFATSVKDELPLKLACLARDCGIPVLCLLDNWMNYSQRLAIEGQAYFWPDLYLVMDQMAFDDACMDGVPQNILRIVGQPALSSVAQEYSTFKQMLRADLIKKYNIHPDKKILVFISEPVEQDQGKDQGDSTYRGYTEKIVLKELCQRMSAYVTDYQLLIIPHPREIKEDLEIVWQKYRGSLEGRVVQFQSGREAVFLADGVVGMVSILLYEAWLINKPVLSLQPGLLKKTLESIFLREGVFVVRDFFNWDRIMAEWLGNVNQYVPIKGNRQELQCHVNASDYIIDCMNKVL